MHITEPFGASFSLDKKHGAVAASFIILRLTAVPVQDPMKSFRRMCLYIRMATLGKERGVLPVLAVLLLLMFTSFLTQVYASLAIGHQWTAHRIPGSLLALAASSVLRYIAARVLSFAGYEIGMRKIVSAWMNQGNMSVWKAMAVNGLFNLLLMLIFGFITRFVLDRKSAQI